MNDLVYKINQKGVSLTELLISIVVGSMVISMLMAILAMSVKAKASFDYESKMLNESYFIAEYIRFSIFELEPQSIEFIEDTATQTVIHINHDYDITVDPFTHTIIRDYSNPVTDIILLDKVNEQLYYNGVLIHDSNVFITSGSSISLISIDPSTCDLATAVCEEGVLQLTLEISIEIDGGVRLNPQVYVTTIII